MCARLWCSGVVKRYALYGLPALQPLRFAASPLMAFHMHVCVWHTGRGVNKEGFGGLVVLLRFRLEALVAFRFVEVP